jgi:hypothetical protein
MRTRSLALCATLAIACSPGSSSPPAPRDSTPTGTPTNPSSTTPPATSDGGTDDGGTTATTTNPTLTCSATDRTRCQGNLLFYCDDKNAIMMHDCAGSGWTCMVDVCEPGAACCPPGSVASTVGCGTVTGLGACVGNVLQFCAGGKLFKIDCAAEQLSCKADGMKGFDCL